MGDILAATESAIAAATHLGAMDAGAIEALRSLAANIDAADERWDARADDALEHNLRPPAQDNVSIPTYLKFCESLGLTPAGRVRLNEEKKGNAGGKLASLSPIKRPKRTA